MYQVLNKLEHHPRQQKIHHPPKGHTQSTCTLCTQSGGQHTLHSINSLPSDIIWCVRVNQARLNDLDPTPEILSPHILDCSKSRESSLLKFEKAVKAASVQPLDRRALLWSRYIRLLNAHLLRLPPHPLS